MFFMVDDVKFMHFFSSRNSVLSYNKKYLFYSVNGGKENSCLWCSLYHFTRSLCFTLHTAYLGALPFTHILPSATHAHKGPHYSLQSWVTARLPSVDNCSKGIPEHFIKSPFHVLATGKDIREHHESLCPSSAGDILLSVLLSLKKKLLGNH